jgi:formyltetrahydrofolate synthetase
VFAADMEADMEADMAADMEIDIKSSAAGFMRRRPSIVATTRAHHRRGGPLSWLSDSVRG